MRPLTSANDSPETRGGRIPGSPGHHAYSLSGPQPSALPVLIAVPHAGRAYPRKLLKDMRHPGPSALKLEDRYVDRIAHAVSRATGATLLIAQAPRAMIDLNRAPDDIDWDMIVKADRPDAAGVVTSRRARGGLGLIPRRLPGIGEIWRHLHRRADLDERLACIHEPYHATLARQLQAMRERWGAALLLDLHSMPPVTVKSFSGPPEFVLGDRFGASCHGSLVASAFAHFSEQGRRVAHNRPYAGGYVLERHAAREAGFHALQLEIDRSSYLDERLAEPGEGFARTVELVTGLVRRLAAEMTALGRDCGPSDIQQAAE